MQCIEESDVKMYCAVLLLAGREAHHDPLRSPTPSERNNLPLGVDPLCVSLCNRVRWTSYGIFSAYCSRDISDLFPLSLTIQKTKQIGISSVRAMELKFSYGSKCTENKSSMNLFRSRLYTCTRSLLTKEIKVNLSNLNTLSRIVNSFWLQYACHFRL